MYRHMLVPIDGTDLATELCTNAVEFARVLGARITYFHAQPDYTAALDGQAEILRMTSPDKFAFAYAGRVRELLAKAEAAARAFGIECGSATSVSDSPARAIITAARRSNCDLIYMASHGRRSNLGMMLGSQTLKVLVNAGMPVLVATTSTAIAQSQVADLIRDEHRSLAAVLRVLLGLIDDRGDAPAPPDARLLQAITGYIEAFSGTFHRPKEEDYLLPRLIERSSRYEQEIAQLRLQHEQGRERAGALVSMVGRFLAGECERSTLKAMVGECEASLWQHMRHVESVILPAALCHLTPDDWDRINAAFAKDGDPRFKRSSRMEFRQTFSRIVNQAIEKPATIQV